mmetsp:Transcript_21020/g.53929  ORF Transcript_21020/g.53929 Transcript_21020/m.53929 type:complete len:229 (+) Transcript_21020:297-983(+)
MYPRLSNRMTGPSPFNRNLAAAFLASSCASTLPSYTWRAIGRLSEFPARSTSYIVSAWMPAKCGVYKRIGPHISWPWDMPNRIGMLNELSKTHVNVSESPLRMSTEARSIKRWHSPYPQYCGTAISSVVTPFLVRARLTLLAASWACMCTCRTVRPCIPLSSARSKSAPRARSINWAEAREEKLNPRVSGDTSNWLAMKAKLPILDGRSAGPRCNRSPEASTYFWATS